MNPADCNNDNGGAVQATFVIAVLWPSCTTATAARLLNCDESHARDGVAHLACGGIEFGQRFDRCHQPAIRRAFRRFGTVLGPFPGMCNARGNRHPCGTDPDLLCGLDHMTCRPTAQAATADCSV